VSGPSAEDLRERIAEFLDRMCSHLQDDDECRDGIAAGLRDLIQPELDAKDAQLAAQAEAMAELDDKATQAYEDRDEAAHRAEQAETQFAEFLAAAKYASEQITEWRTAELAELEQWRACFGETALKDARGVLAERDQLRAADGRVRQALAKWDEDTVHDTDALGILLDDLRAALDQAPADEPDDYAARLSPTRVVSVAANSIGYAIQQVCHLDLHVDAVTAAAQRLYDQGLLKTPVDGQFAEDWTATEEQQNATHGNEAQR
jgi:hypothetical protein